MQRLRETYPGTQFLFVIGADLLGEIQTPHTVHCHAVHLALGALLTPCTMCGTGEIRSWAAPGVPDAGERLYSECEFLLMERPGYDLPERLPPNFHVLVGDGSLVHNVVSEEISSSEIRRRILPPSTPPHLGPRRESQVPIPINSHTY